MNALRMTCAALVATLGAGWLVGPARAEPSNQPPMNEFNQAFYRCDNGAAFMMSYDADQPTKADMTTNEGNHSYELKRTQAASGFQFSGDGARFWTDGKTVVVEGPKLLFKNCKTKIG